MALLEYAAMFGLPIAAIALGVYLVVRSRRDAESKAGVVLLAGFGVFLIAFASFLLYAGWSYLTRS